MYKNFRAYGKKDGMLLDGQQLSSFHLHHHKTYIGRCAFRSRFAGSHISAGVDQLKGSAGQAPGGKVARWQRCMYIDVLFSSGGGGTSNSESLSDNIYSAKQVGRLWVSNDDLDTAHQHFHVVP
jgi:hypothetical protein